MQITEHHKTALSRLLQGEGWNVVMQLIGQRLAYFEKQLRPTQGVGDLRLHVLERRNELLDMVGRLYRTAGQPNPFDEAASALWATELRLPEPTADEVALEAEDAAEQLRHRRHQSGGIA